VRKGLREEDSSSALVPESSSVMAGRTGGFGKACVAMVEGGFATPAGSLGCCQQDSAKLTLS